jgi:hypothetical protein
LRYGHGGDILVAEYRLWDFLDERQENVILQWVKDDDLTKRDRAVLNQKINRLSQMDYDLAKQTKLLAGPIYKHVYKLVIHGDVMLRPMLCRGPILNTEEYTFLIGVVETGGRLPAGVKEKAENRRLVVVKDQRRRVQHEQIP